MIELRCHKKEILDDQLKILSSKDYQVCIAIHNSEILAFEDVCSHDGESFDGGTIENGCIVCPRHMAKFEMKSGRAICMPAVEDIRTFAVKVEGEEIIVVIEE
ncbi:MAG: non-heme iron oxygenase ferredoxin subunit [Spirochaetia bacterium]|nr:non-heme iron oxygenase ferredoxin subunit [Spirochaetia bacterium]